MRSGGQGRVAEICFLALFLLHSLAPALGALAGVPRKIHFAHICTSDGQKRIVAADGPARQPVPEQFANKCSLCSAGGGHAEMDLLPGPDSALHDASHATPLEGAGAGFISQSLPARFARGPPLQV